MSILATHQLSASIAGQNICNELNLKIEPKQCWGILGRNGIGKSTLMRTLSGLRSADGGTVSLMDKALSDYSRRQVAQHIGILFQDSDDPFPSTVMETALIGRHPYLDNWQWETENDINITRQALHQVGLTGFEARMVDTLSGGERQRLAIASVLVQEPDLFFLDEPTNHLDMHHQVILLSLLANRVSVENKAMVMIMHDINLAARFCDHLLLMFNKGNTLHGPIDEVLNAENLEQLYQHPVMAIDTPDGTVWLPG